jgi:hypothetical protein
MRLANRPSPLAGEGLPDSPFVLADAFGSGFLLQWPAPLGPSSARQLGQGPLLGLGHAAQAGFAFAFDARDIALHHAHSGSG